MTRAGIEQIFNELVDSWNRGDASSFAQLFTPEAFYVDFSGTLSIGRAAIERAHAFLFAGPLQGSRLEYEQEKQTRWVAPNVAIVVARGRSRLPGTEAGPDRESINTSVLVQDNGRWLIAAFQNGRVLSAVTSAASAGERP